MLKAIDSPKGNKPNAVSLDVCNGYLLKCMDTLGQKREEISKKLQRHQQQKAKLEQTLQILNKKLSKLNELIDQEQGIVDDCNKTINETEAAYRKIATSSNALLNVFQHETKSILNKCHIVEK